MTPVSLILTLSRAANEGRAAAATSCMGCSCSLAGGELKGAQSCISMENGEPRKMGIEVAQSYWIDGNSSVLALCRGIPDEKRQHGNLKFQP
ncbi:uncharacterized protein CCOS01_01796 [Colletotrichum costaricense]|uniref:Uncharacterized protein n=1 Tax=Colletotrichum costaricense TaxID=1209916 RepID=A0AAI9Z6K2_9PEZI|nr:uncharacterized protein CCOS01_01796 [Colletotrichum costaricense]KAK1536476.1 hypothetical protein CCOS01_01796 [Colletotrichum costaricense]